MTLPSPSQPISLLNVQLEHGGTYPISINEYYSKGNAPASGQISLNDLYQVPPSKKTSGLVFDLDATNSSSYPGSGTTWFDISGNSRNFSLVNGPSAGINAIEFDGVDDYAQIANAAWIPQGTSPKSFECYARIDAWRTGQTVNFISKTSPSNQSFTFGIKESSGVISIFLATQGSGGNFSENSDRYIIPNPSNYLGSYHHYAFTYNGSIAKIYIDGSLVYTSSSGKLFRTNTAPMRLFCFDPSNASFSWNVDGAMRGARMYNVELTAAEILNNYQVWLYGFGSYLPTIDSVLTVPAVPFHYGSTFTLDLNFDQNVLVDTSKIVVTNGTSVSSVITGVTTAKYSLDITSNPSTSNVNVSISTTASINAGNKGNNGITTSITYSSISKRLNSIIWLDATNSSSYSGIGTIWTDVAGIITASNGTLYNGPVFVNTGQKTFTFDGTNPGDYVQVNWPTSTMTDVSIGFWIKTTSQNGRGYTTFLDDGGAIFDSGWPYNVVMSMSVGKILFGTNLPQVSTIALNDGIWHYVVGTRLSNGGAPDFLGKEHLYIDGQLNVNGNGDAGSKGVTQFNIGRFMTQATDPYDATKYYNGSISQVQVWNTVLTAAEVAQTWNSQKAYYGR